MDHAVEIEVAVDPATGHVEMICQNGEVREIHFPVGVCVTANGKDSREQKLRQQEVTITATLIDPLNRQDVF